MLHSAVPALSRLHVSGQRAAHAAMLFAAVVAAILIVSFTSFASVSRAASPSDAELAAAAFAPSAAQQTTPVRAADVVAPQKRAVIVVGPVASQTAEYVKDAKAIAKALKAAGVTVTLIIPPHATWANVAAAAEGADFFAYLGHGNGWPSPYTSNGEESHDGMGLDPTDGDINYAHVTYYGANYLMGGFHCTIGVPSPTTQAACKQLKYGVWKDYGAGIHLAGDAIVLLNHLCYASGNAEPGMAIPKEAVAVERADNHAAGWLAAGARVVFALAWQPGQDIVNWLVSKHITMDKMFKLRDAKNGSASSMPFHGWVGSQPSLYFDSARTQGARVHLDPDLAPAHDNGYLRAVTGDLTFTTDAWWAAGN